MLGSVYQSLHRTYTEMSTNFLEDGLNQLTLPSCEDCAHARVLISNVKT